jgi:tetratricopeptide (TPR) repeat protein
LAAKSEREIDGTALASPFRAMTKARQKGQEEMMRANIHNERLTDLAIGLVLTASIAGFAARAAAPGGDTPIEVAQPTEAQKSEWKSTADKLIIDASAMAQKKENPPQAIEKLEQALQLYEKLGDRGLQAHCHHELGYLNQKDVNKDGDNKLAVQHYEKALALSDGNEKRSARAQTLTNLGYILRPDVNPDGNWARSMDSYRQAIAIYEDLGLMKDAVVRRKDLAEVMMPSVNKESGDWNAAADMYKQAADMALESGLTTHAAHSHFLAAAALHHKMEGKGDVKAALKEYETAAKLWGQTPDKLSQAEALFNAAWMSLPLFNPEGSYEKSAERGEAADKIYKELDSKAGMGKSLFLQVSAKIKADPKNLTPELRKDLVKAAALSRAGNDENFANQAESFLK